MSTSSTSEQYSLRGLKSLLQFPSCVKTDPITIIIHPIQQSFPFLILFIKLVSWVFSATILILHQAQTTVSLENTDLATMSMHAQNALAPAVTETSQWSAHSATSTPEIVFASRTPSIGFGEDHMSSFGVPWTDFTSSKATWGCNFSPSPSEPIHKSTYGYLRDVDFHLDNSLVSDTSCEPYVHVA